MQELDFGGIYIRETNGLDRGWVEFYIKNKLKSGAHMGTPLLACQ